MSEEKQRKDLHTINCKETETENDIGKYTMSRGVGTPSTAYLYQQNKQNIMGKTCEFVNTGLSPNYLRRCR